MHPDGTSFSEPHKSCSGAVIKRVIEQEVASTTGKVARQFQESQLHLQLELRPVLEEGRESRQEWERESACARGGERESKSANKQSTVSCRALAHVLTGRSVSLQPCPFRNSKRWDQFQVPLCDCASASSTHNTEVLGNPTRHSKRKAEDTNTDEMEPESQQDSSVMRDRGLGLPQHPSDKVMRNHWFTIRCSLFSLLSEAILVWYATKQIQCSFIGCKITIKSLIKICWGTKNLLHNYK